MPVCISSITEKHRLSTLQRAHSLRSKRSIQFRGKERPRNGVFGFDRARNRTRVKKCAIFRAVFDSRSSFFAPKPHGNACYAGFRAHYCVASFALQLQQVMVTPVPFHCCSHEKDVYPFTWNVDARNPSTQMFVCVCKCEGTLRGDRRSLKASSPIGGYRKIPKISPSMYKPPKLVTQKTLR